MKSKKYCWFCHMPTFGKNKCLDCAAWNGRFTASPSLIAETVAREVLSGMKMLHEEGYIVSKWVKPTKYSAWLYYGVKKQQYKRQLKKAAEQGYIKQQKKRGVWHYTATPPGCKELDSDFYIQKF